MSRTPKILCILTLFLFLLLFVQERTHFIGARSLKGAFEYPAEFPDITWQGWKNGSLQQGLERYSKDHFGFREGAIRTHNQLLWTLFHQNNTNGAVQIGKDNYLYEPYFVEDHYESRMYKYTSSPEELLQRWQRTISRLVKIQEILDEHHTTLFLACLPGKDRIFPEYLPPRDTLTRAKGPVAIECMPAIFDSLGLRYVNICQWFERLKGHTSYPLFTPLGTHWSNIASVYGFDSILHYMERVGNCTLPPYLIGAPHEGPTRKPDADLADLMNLVFPIRTAVPNQYVEVRALPSKDTSAAKPGLIVIGDSFFWNVEDNFPLNDLFRYHHYWYYFNTIYFDPDHDNTASIDLVAQLADADYVMLSYCSAQLYDIGVNTAIPGMDFETRALIELCYDPAEIDAKVAEIAGMIRADEGWLASLQQKAATAGVSLEEQLRTDARYLLYTNPEQYFPALAEPHPTPRCSRWRQS